MYSHDIKVGQTRLPPRLRGEGTPLQVGFTVEAPARVPEAPPPQESHKVMIITVLVSQRKSVFHNKRSLCTH